MGRLPQAARNLRSQKKLNYMLYLIGIYGNYRPTGKKNATELGGKGWERGKNDDLMLRVI